MWVINSKQAAAEAKKAEGASCTALLIPSPPLLTGSIAWDQAGSSKWMLTILLTVDLKRLSYSWRLGERKQGEVLR